MTFKIKLLSAAAFLALPAVSLAQQPSGTAAGQTAQPQATQPQTGTTMQNVTQTVQGAQDNPAPAGETQVVDEQPRQAQQPAQQPSQQPPAEADTQGQTQTGSMRTQPPATGSPPASTTTTTPPTGSPPADTPPTGTQTGTATPPAGTQAQTGAQTGTQAGTQTNAQAGAQAQGTQATGSTGAATAADLRAGAEVRDTSGAMVGTVESADADSAIVSTGSVRADIPIASFGRNGQGLVLSMTRAQLEAAARARTPTP